MKSCKNCLLCCPKNGYPCKTWEMYSDEVSEEELAKDCTDYIAKVHEEPETERYYSPREVYSVHELY